MLTITRNCKTEEIESCNDFPTYSEGSSAGQSLNIGSGYSKQTTSFSNGIQDESRTNFGSI